MKMIIELNEKQIFDEGYDAEKIWKFLERIIIDEGIKRSKKGEYESIAGNENAFTNFMAAITALEDYDIFTKYVITWLWYGDEDDIEKDEPENIIEKFNLYYEDKI